MWSGSGEVQCIVASGRASVSWLGGPSLEQTSNHYDDHRDDDDDKCDDDEADDDRNEDEDFVLFNHPCFGVLDSSPLQSP